MAIYTYNFTAADGTDLEDIASTPWVNVRTANGAEVLSNQLKPVNGSATCCYYYNNTFAEAHYTEIVLKASAAGAGDYIHVNCRITDGSNYYYCALGTVVYNGERVGAVSTDWDSGLTTASVNDVFGLYIDPTTTTTVYYKVNDSTVATYTGKSNLSGGRAGVGANGASGSPTSRADDWEGGDVVTESSSVSPSVSPSASVSPSVSPSESPSLSPSSSESPSESPSVSPSESPSLSPSSSESPSESPSVSPSVSPSGEPLSVCPIVWGQDTGVTEVPRTFAGNWNGTGLIEGAGDAERLALDAGEYMESEVVETGTVDVYLGYNIYQAGDLVTFEYRHGDSEAACLLAAYNVYIAPFASLGFVQIKVSAP